MNREEFISAINPFLPKHSADVVADWVFNKNLQLKIVNDRKTKLGDFRARRRNESSHIITINGGLNPYDFLITLVHEFAHLEVYEKYGRKVQPHGKEWKNTYRNLMQDYLKLDIFPNELKFVLQNHLKNPKASSSGDLHLLRAIAAYDENTDGSIYLEELEEGQKFIVGGKLLIKGKKRRTRYMCQEVNSKRLFTVSTLAKVEVWNNY